jgi:hypothetical protein
MLIELKYVDPSHFRFVFFHSKVQRLLKKTEYELTEFETNNMGHGICNIICILPQVWWAALYMHSGEQK